MKETTELVGAKESLWIISKRIDELEKQADELGRIRATLMVNFGWKHGRCQDGVCVGDECESTHDIFMSVLTQYHEKLR